MKIFLLTILLLIAISNGSLKGQSSQSKLYNLEKGIAIQGYDPVSYFKNEKPKKGKSSISKELDGVIYYFASSEARDLFIANPTAYQPAYGGWCAYAMGIDGSKVKIDPKTFKIVEGKLYLFYNFYLNNTMKKWNQDEGNLKRNADSYWAKIGTVDQ